jgi:hypothetical protein
MGRKIAYRLIGGPMDGQWIVPEKIPLEIMGNPSVGLFPLGGDNEIQVRRGYYEGSEKLHNALQWSGWK